MLPLILALALAVSGAGRQTLAPGQILPDVVCAADASETYALYLPSGYTAARAWPVILAFDPGGRGTNPVERYRAAAELYGYVVAGSNNSRNGSTDTSHAVSAMWNDVAARVRVDPARVYTAGMSGGARVAMAVALGSSKIAGVVASSAGFPDGVPARRVGFPMFATAGTEDFNHLEMRELDRVLTSPHRLEVFQGGHVWPPADLVMDAIEWLELEAMKTGAKPRDTVEIDRIFAKRTAAAAAAAAPVEQYLALLHIAADFAPFEDVSAIAARAQALAQDRQVRAALARDREEDARETQLLADVAADEARLANPDDRPLALARLRQAWKDAAARAGAADDSADRRVARRVIGALSAGTSTADPDYLRIIRQYRVGRGGM